MPVMPDRQGRGCRDDLKRPSIVAHNTQAGQDADARMAPACHMRGSSDWERSGIVQTPIRGGNLRHAAGRDDTGPPKEGDPVFYIFFI